MSDKRKARVVSIVRYTKARRLHGSANDTLAVAAVLARNGDGTVNFEMLELVTATGPGNSVSRIEIKTALNSVSDSDDYEIALFYFAGLGYLEAKGGQLSASDCVTGDDGLSLHEIVLRADRLLAKNKIIVLDICRSGEAGIRATDSGKSSELSEGLTILTA